MEKLLRFGPDVLDSMPSFFLLLMKEMEEGGQEIRPRRIFASGELLDARSRAFINSAFKVDVIDVYGCTERVTLLGSVLNMLVITRILTWWCQNLSRMVPMQLWGKLERLF